MSLLPIHPRLLGIVTKSCSSMTTNASTDSNSQPGSRQNSMTFVRTKDPVGSDYWPKTPVENEEIDPFIFNSGDGTKSALAGFFDITSFPGLNWGSFLEPGADPLDSDGFFGTLADQSIDLKTSSRMQGLHVDDLFDNPELDSSDSNMASSPIHLPGWNHGPEVAIVLPDSCISSAQGIWMDSGCQPFHTLPSNYPNQIHPALNGNPNIETIPGLNTIAPSVLSPDSAVGSLSVPKTLRQCISAPHLQRDDPVLEASRTQHVINEFLVEAGYPKDRILDKSQVGSDSVEEDDEPGETQDEPATDEKSSDTVSADDLFQVSTETEKATNDGLKPATTSSAEPEQQQVDGNGSKKESKENGTTTGQSQINELVNAVKPSASSSKQIDIESLTEEQKLRLGQLYQVHAAQQAKTIQPWLVHANGAQQPPDMSSQHPLQPGTNPLGYGFNPMPLSTSAAVLHTVPRSVDGFGNGSMELQQRLIQNNNPTNLVMQSDMFGYTSVYPPPRPKRTANDRSLHSYASMSSLLPSSTTAMYPKTFTPASHSHLQVPSQPMGGPLSPSHYTLSSPSGSHLPLPPSTPRTLSPQISMPHLNSASASLRVSPLSLPNPPSPSPLPKRLPPSSSSLLKMKSTPHLGNSKTLRKIASNKRIQLQPQQPPPLPPLPSFNLSFVNYGLEDAEELCSAVAPSGSCKVPLKGYQDGIVISDNDEEQEEEEELEEDRCKKVKKNPTIIRKNSSLASIRRH